jgi:hypothetical protein
VTISLATNAATTAFLGIEFWIEIGAEITIVIGVCLLLYFKKRNR